MICLYLSILVQLKEFNCSYMWNEHCQEQIYTLVQTRLHEQFSKSNLSFWGLIRWSLLFLFLYLSLEGALSTWCISLTSYLRLILLCRRSLSHSSSKESGEEFNEVWVCMSFREICNSYVCICHSCVSDQSSFLLMLATLNKESLKVIKCKLC